jgi:hypothetical protein
MDVLFDRLMHIQSINEITGENVTITEQDYFELLDDFFKNSEVNPPNNDIPNYLIFYSYAGVTSFSYDSIEHRFNRFHFLMDIYDHGVDRKQIQSMIRLLMRKHHGIKKIVKFDYSNRKPKTAGIQAATPE